MDRRIMMSGNAWSPQSSRPTAWYYAAGQYVSLNGSGVVNWNDRLANGGDIIQVSPGFQPTWESVNGWSASKASIRAGSDPLNSTGSGAAPIESAFSGLQRPFTVLITGEDLFLSSSSTVAKWTGAGGVLQSCVIDGSNFLSVTRSDGGTTETVTATTNAVGSGHIRLAFTFDYPAVRAYLGTLQVLSGSSPNVLSTTYTAFTLGDVRDFRYTEVVVYPRALSAAEVALYYAYSLNEWGA